MTQKKKAPSEKGVKTTKARLQPSPSHFFMRCNMLTHISSWKTIAHIGANVTIDIQIEYVVVVVVLLVLIVGTKR